MLQKSLLLTSFYPYKVSHSDSCSNLSFAEVAENSYLPKQVCIGAARGVIRSDQSAHLPPHVAALLHHHQARETRAEHLQSHLSPFMALNSSDRLQTFVEHLGDHLNWPGQRFPREIIPEIKNRFHLMVGSWYSAAASRHSAILPGKNRQTYMTVFHQLKAW